MTTKKELTFFPQSEGKLACYQDQIFYLEVYLKYFCPKQNINVLIVLNDYPEEGFAKAWKIK